MNDEEDYETDWSTMRQTEQGTWMVCTKPKPQKIQINIEVYNETDRKTMGMPEGQTEGHHAEQKESADHNQG